MRELAVALYILLKRRGFEDNGDENETPEFEGERMVPEAPEDT